MNSNVEIRREEIPLISEKLIRRSLVFIPGVYIVLIFSGILILLTGFSILYLLENALSVFISAFSIPLAFAVGVGMIFGIVGVLKGLYRAIWNKTGYEVALQLHMETEPELFRFINVLCHEMECDLPDAVILHADQTK